MIRKYIIYCEIVSPNRQEHWAKKLKRKHHQEIEVMSVLNLEKFTLPAIVTLTKVGGRKMDLHDNMRMACKGIVDRIAVYLTGDQVKGRGDSNPQITWLYEHKSKKEKEEPYLEISIEDRIPNASNSNRK